MNRADVRQVVSEVADFAVTNFCLESPIDVAQRHVDFVYNLLWMNDELKFAVEMNISGDDVRHYIELSVLNKIARTGRREVRHENVDLEF